jgi:hypothetical protein
MSVQAMLCFRELTGDRIVQETMDHVDHGEEAQSAFSAISALEDISPDAL